MILSSCKLLQKSSSEEKCAEPRDSQAHLGHQKPRVLKVKQKASNSSSAPSSSETKTPPSQPPHQQHHAGRPPPIPPTTTSTPRPGFGVVPSSAVSFSFAFSTNSRLPLTTWTQSVSSKHPQHTSHPPRFCKHWLLCSFRRWAMSRGR